MIFCLLTIIGWLIWGALYVPLRLARAFAPFVPVAIFCCLFIIFLAQRSMIA